MKAWYFDDQQSDPRDSCKLNGSPTVTLKDLERIQVECLQFNADDYENDAKYQMFKKERGYDYQDIITVNRNTIPDYNAKIASFLREHIHDDEETRAIQDGNGYFDVRGTISSRFILDHPFFR